MARQDSTGRPDAGGDRRDDVSDPRSRFRVVGSGSGDRGREGPYRPFQAAVRESVGAAGGTGGYAPAGRLSLPSPEATLQATPLLSNCPDCSASLAVLRVISGRAGAEYWTMRCTRCGGVHLDIVKAAAAPLTV